MTQLAFTQPASEPKLTDLAGVRVTTTCRHLPGMYVVERVNEKDLPWPIAFLDGGEKGAWCQVKNLRSVDSDNVR